MLLMYIVLPEWSAGHLACCLLYRFTFSHPVKPVLIGCDFYLKMFA